MAFDWASAFGGEREHLFAVAYRMLGSAAEAEDVLQDAFLRVQGTEEVPRSARAMLTTVVVRLCLDTLKSARARREAYVGPWLPEPIAASISADNEEVDRSPEGAFGKAESLSMGLLVVLETLSPLERAAFLLREAFDYDFAEIAEALGRSLVAPGEPIAIVGDGELADRYGDAVGIAGLTATILPAVPCLARGWLLFANDLPRTEP
jgi:RNA polymerase sigma-70 factor (ECF subfamily)